MSNLIKLLEQYQNPEKSTFGFDYFDTVVTRSIDPESIKVVWSERIRQAMGLPMEAKQIHAWRVETELNHCLRNKANGLDDEFSYLDCVGEIYRKKIFPILDKNPQKKAASWSEAEFIDTSTKIDIGLELKYQSLIPDTRDALIYLQQKKARIILISDFFYPSRFFKKFLEHHGILDFFENVFVSCDKLLTKRSGRMYEGIFAELSIDPANFVMIGDNQYADSQVPELLGARSIFIPRSEQKEFYAQDAAVDHERIFFEQLDNIVSGDNELPFNEIAGVLFLFILKLFHNVRLFGGRKVLFLSREGEFLKKLFDDYLKAFSFEEFAESDYLMVSRRSTFLPSILNHSKDSKELFDFGTLFRQYRKISLKEFCLNLSLEDAVIDRFRAKTGLDFERRIENLPESDEFKSLLNDAEFAPCLIRLAKEQRANFLEYLGKISTPDKLNQLHIVDIGWKGTIQDNIRKCLISDTKLVGYYFGLLSYTDISLENTKCPQIFSVVEPLNRSLIPYSECITLLEIICSASHGSVKSYGKGSEGEIVPLTEEVQVEQEFFKNYIAPLQTRIRAQFNELCVNAGRHLPDLNKLEKVIALKYARIAYAPSAEEIKIFEMINNYENFGLFEFTSFNNGNISFQGKLKKKISNIFLRNNSWQQKLWPTLALIQSGMNKSASNRYREMLQNIDTLYAA